MAHNITIINNVAEAVYAKEPAWHKHGTVLPVETMTAEEALEGANMNYPVEKKPIHFLGDMGFRVDIPGKFATVRTDYNIPLGVVGRRYQVLQNKDAFKFMDNLTQDPNGPKYESAGTLLSGTRVWLLLRCPEVIEVKKVDKVNTFLLLTHGHDGNHPVIVQWTPIRVVCNNTLTLALSQSTLNRAVIRHTANLHKQLEAVQDALGIIRQKSISFAEVAEAMASKKPTQAQVEMVLSKLFDKADDGAEEKGQVQNKKDRVLDLWGSGDGNDLKSARGTFWGLYNGVTQYADRELPVRATQNRDASEARLDSAWFGSASKLKVASFDMIKELVAPGR